MKKIMTTALAIVVLLGAEGCSSMTTQQQRALSGGAIGAAGAAGIAYIAGGPVLGAALLGGAAGTAVGALTSPNHSH